MSMTREQQIAALKKDWAENPRWKGVKRGYSAEDVKNGSKMRFIVSADIPVPVSAMVICT
jgi:isocitrate lyase